MTSERNIILIGMPAVGKSAIGWLIAQRLGRAFFDSDAEIEAREGKTCAQIINESGEPAFRTIEREIIANLVTKQGIVLAVGGGAPLTCDDLLRQRSVVVYLRRELDELAASLTGNSRPLSRSREDLERLHSERHTVYASLTHVTVFNNSTREATAAQVVDAIMPHLTSRLLVINGPNLNLLGTREPHIYGNATQADLIALLQSSAAERGIVTDFMQSNYEGAIINALHDTVGVYDGIVINPAAYTHYSYAIHDALKAINLPAVEIHISDISTREEFRRHSVTASACIAQISGEGFQGYIHAMDTLLEALR